MFELLRGMEEDMDTYLALTNPEASTWTPNLKGFAQNLHMFSVRQPFPLLIAAHRKFSASDSESLFRSCATISFRYNVIGSLSTSDQERVYAGATAGILAKTYLAASAVLQALTPVYPNDAAFKASFVEKSITTTQSRNRRIVRYTLTRIERHCSGNDYDFDSDSFNIEHVLPQHPVEGWDSFPEHETEHYIYRLGNMTLLASNANNDLGPSPYATKRESYLQSVFQITRKLAEDNSEWDPERLGSRQQWMANQAASLWRIAQLS